MIQVFNIAEGIIFLTAGFFVLWLKGRMPDEAEKPFHYPGKITEISPDSVIIRWQSEDGETEQEFPKQMLPHTAYRQSLKPGMKVTVCCPGHQVYVTSVGERKSRRDMTFLAVICFVVAFVFFTGKF